MEEKKVLDFGKSMYGGWYANTIASGEFSGVRADTLKALKEELTERGFSADLTHTTRRDND